jgi:chorismate dehydratase
LLKYKIGKFGFLNNFLPYYFLEKNYEVVEATPRVMAGMLLDGYITYAPVPLFFFLKESERLKSYSFCVASKERALSVVVVSKKRDFDDGCIAVTNQSITSMNLLKVILSEKGLSNTPVVKESGSAWELLRDCDHALVIGDEAIKARMVFRVHMDLGEEWYDLTGLPMVFGISASLKEFDAEKIDADVMRSTMKGFKHFDDVLKKATKIFNMPEEFLREYFNALSFEVGMRERKGIETFEEYCMSYGLLKKDGR